MYSIFVMVFWICVAAVCAAIVLPLVLIGVLALYAWIAGEEIPEAARRMDKRAGLGR